MTFFTGILLFGISLESQHAMRISQSTTVAARLRLHNDEACKTMNLPDIIRGPCRKNTWNHGVVHAGPAPIPTWKPIFVSPNPMVMAGLKTSTVVERIPSYEKTITRFPLKIDFEYLWLDQKKVASGTKNQAWSAQSF